MLAVLERHTEVAQLLLNFKADPHSVDMDGRSPLSIADAKGLTELVSQMSNTSGHAPQSASPAISQTKDRTVNIQSPKWSIDPKKLAKRVKSSRGNTAHKLDRQESDGAKAKAESLITDRSAAGLFRSIENVRLVAHAKAKKLELSTVQEFLKLALQLANVKPETKDDIHWAALFRMRMLETASVLSSNQLDHLCTLMEKYESQENNSAASIYLIMAKSLRLYLLCHLHDPENSIVGLKCKPSLIESFSRITQTMQIAQRVLGSEAWLIGKSPTAIDSSSITFTASVSFTHSKSAIQDILASQELSDADKLTRIDSFLQFAEAVNQLPSHWEKRVVPGDFLIVAVTRPKETLRDIFADLLPAHTISRENQTGTNPETSADYLFLRYSGQYDQEKQLVSVYTKPDELETIQVPLYLCMPFPSSWELNFGHASSVDRLIDNPAVSLYSRLVLYLKEAMNNLLQERSLDMDLLERVIVFDVEVAEKDQVQGLLSLLQQLQDELPSEFLQQVTQRSRECIERLENAAMPLFQPTQQEHLEVLHSFSMETLVRERLDRLSAFCRQTLAFLDNQSVLVVNGTKKQEITSWWLSVIQQRVQRFLTGLHFDFEAVPYDYIDTPPNSLETIRTNLKIIQEILDRSNDIHNVQQLLDNVKEDVYPKINLFLDNAKAALCEKLNLSLKDFSVEAARDMLNEHERDLKDQKDEPEHQELWGVWMVGLLQDIEYLETIKRLEEEPVAGKGNLNVVPITGLVMSAFIRRETELRTVLEVWDPSWKVSRRSKRSVYRKSLDKRVSILISSRSENLRGDITPNDWLLQRQFHAAVPRAERRSHKADLGHHRILPSQVHTGDTSVACTAKVSFSLDVEHEMAEDGSEGKEEDEEEKEKEEGADPLEEEVDLLSSPGSMESILSNLSSMVTMSRETTAARLHQFERSHSRTGLL